MTDTEQRIFDTLGGSSFWCISLTLNHISEEYKFDYEMRIRLSDAILTFYDRFREKISSVPGRETSNEKIISKRIGYLFEYAGIPARDEDKFVADGTSSFPAATSKGNGRYYYARKASNSFLSYGDDLILKFSQSIHAVLGFSGKAYIDTINAIAKLWFVSDHRALFPRGIYKQELLDVSSDPEEAEKVIEFLKFPNIKETKFRIYEFDGILYCSDFYVFAEKKLALLDYDERLCTALHHKDQEAYYLEDKVAQTLKKAMPHAKIWQGVYLNGFETDVIALEGDDLFVFECKADKFTPWMMENEKRRNSAEKELIKASEQLLVRAKKCIELRIAKVTDKKGVVLETILPKKYIRSYVVTQENLLGLSYLSKETAKRMHFKAFPFIFSYDDLAFDLEWTSKTGNSAEFLRLCSEGEMQGDHLSGLFEYDPGPENLTGDVKNVIFRNKFFTEKMTNLFFKKEIESNADDGSEVFCFFKTLVKSIPPQQKELICDLLKIKNQFLACRSVDELTHKRYVMDRYDLTLSGNYSPKRAAISFICSREGTLESYVIFDNLKEQSAYFDCGRY